MFSGLIEKPVAKHAILLQAVNIDISPIVVKYQLITSGKEQYLKLSFSPLLGLEPQDAHGCLVVMDIHIVGLTEWSTNGNSTI